MRPNRVLQVVSYDAPEVVIWAKEDNDKYDPTAKLVLYGGVVDASSEYELLWTQVSGLVPVIMYLPYVGDKSYQVPVCHLSTGANQVGFPILIRTILSPCH